MIDLAADWTLTSGESPAGPRKKTKPRAVPPAGDQKERLSVHDKTSRSTKTHREEAEWRLLEEEEEEEENEKEEKEAEE